MDVLDFFAVVHFWLLPALETQRIEAEPELTSCVSHLDNVHVDDVRRCKREGKKLRMKIIDLKKKTLHTGMR